IQANYERDRCGNEDTAGQASTSLQVISVQTNRCHREAIEEPQGVACRPLTCYCLTPDSYLCPRYPLDRNIHQESRTGGVLLDTGRRQGDSTVAKRNCFRTFRVVPPGRGLMSLVVLFRALSQVLGLFLTWDSCLSWCRTSRG